MNFCGYELTEVDTDTIKTLQREELKLLNAVVNLCSNCNIPYFAMYGTLLGAVRNGGFIPWDDDIDIAIYEDDLEKIIFSLQFAGIQVFSDKYKTKIYKAHSLAVSEHQLTYLKTLECPEIGIDILPISPVGGAYTDYPGYVSVGRHILPEYYFTGEKTAFFEGLEIRIPDKTDFLIDELYPSGVEEPEEEDRKPKHYDYFALDVSAKILTEKLIHREYGMLKGITPETPVYLFGAGDSLRIFKGRYGGMVNICGVFDNSERKWGTEIYGIPVKNPAEIKNIPANSRIIITSIYAGQITKQLEEADCTDFYIFRDGIKYTEADKNRKIGEVNPGDRVVTKPLDDVHKKIRKMYKDLGETAKEIIQNAATL
jgi:phosphorylcholine metabolism protein LicD